MLHYDRDSLLQLQSQPMSLCKPSNLPNLDVIKNKAYIQRLPEVNKTSHIFIPPSVIPFDPFMPQYPRPSGGNGFRPAHIRKLTEVNKTASIPMPPVKPFDPFMPRHVREENNLILSSAISRQSHQSEDEKSEIIPFPTNQNTKLHESEDEEVDNLFGKVRSILNNLTIKKFQTSVEQIKELPIDTMNKLEGTVNVIYEKAVDERNYTVLCANMSRQLSLMKVPTDDGQGVVNFRKLMLYKCQKEFEQDKRIEKKCEDKTEVMKTIKDDEEKDKEVKLEKEVEKRKMRMRKLGNIRLLVGFFKLKMLAEFIMHECIKKLLARGDEESLECLCELLKTTGKELDDRGVKSRDMKTMNSYFVAMQEIVDKPLTSSRIKFILQDIIELRKNNWIFGKDTNNPKDIDQIHNKAEEEAREAEQAYQNICQFKMSSWR